MVTEKKDCSTQTDHVIHDIFYYKNRAHKAEEAVLMLRKYQYISRLHAELRELEKDTTNKIHLYGYDSDKMHQIKLEFQQATHRTEKLCAKAEEIFAFNMQSLRNGHELNELPLVDDPEVDLNSIQLGPVTPTIGPRNPLLSPPDSLPGVPPSHQGVMNGGGSFSDHRMMAPPPSPFYKFYRSTESNLSPNLNSEVSAPISAAPGTFNMSAGFPPSTIGPNRSHTLPPTSDLADLRAIQPHDLRTVTSTHPTTSSMGGSGVFFDLSSHHVPTPIAPPSSVENGLKPTDVLSKHPPQKVDNLTDTNILRQPNLPITSPMGLDNLDLTYSSLPSGLTPVAASTKWSQVAMSGSALDTDGEWQAVGSRKSKPTANKNASRTAKSLPIGGRADGGVGGGSEENENFEKVVEGAMEKYQLTRPEVIAALQKVRNDRKGDIANFSLHSMMKEAEKIFGHRNILKTTSLTARARAVADHPEPCDNQLCPARLKLLKYRTELCLSYQTSKMCYMKPGSCVYAHGEAELRPLPKEELCERYLEGKCSNSRCVYAHGAAELKNRPMVNPAEYISRKNKKSAAGNTSKTASEDLNLMPADYDPQGEECSICFETMSGKSRKKLDCGHDSFHYKCLKRWVAGEGDRSCPLCRSNTLLPEEYPKLGSR